MKIELQNKLVPVLNSITRPGEGAAICRRVCSRTISIQFGGQKKKEKTPYEVDCILSGTTKA